MSKYFYIMPPIALNLESENKYCRHIYCSENKSCGPFPYACLHISPSGFSPYPSPYLWLSLKRDRKLTKEALTTLLPEF